MMGVFMLKKRNGELGDSFDKDGKCIVTSLTEEDCVRATRFILKGRQEGFDESKTYDSNVGGKL